MVGTLVEWITSGPPTSDVVKDNGTCWTQLQSHVDALQQSGGSSVQVEVVEPSFAVTPGSCTAAIAMAGDSWQAPPIAAAEEVPDDGAVITAMGA